MRRLLTLSDGRHVITNICQKGSYLTLIKFRDRVFMSELFHSFVLSTSFCEMTRHEMNIVKSPLDPCANKQSFLKIVDGILLSVIESSVILRDYLFVLTLVNANVLCSFVIVIFHISSLSLLGTTPPDYDISLTGMVLLEVLSNYF